MNTETKQQIQQFTQAGRGQLNIGQRIRAALWAALAFGSIALLAELPFVLRGHRVALPILLLPLLLSGGVALGCYLRFRYSHLRAVGHIDRFFGLKEGLVTADEHIRAGRRDEIHELQLRHTERALAPLDPETVRPGFPRRLFSLSLVLTLLAACLLLVDDSAAVKQQLAEEASVLSLSEQLSDELQQVLDDLMDQSDPQLKEMLEDPSLKKMIEEFQGSRDRKAVMRKLSEIDRRLTQMQSGLDTRADENYLMELAEQLRQSRETAAIGDSLSKRNYKQAAQELENMQLGEPSGMEQQMALEKLAAQIGETEKSMSQNESGSRRSAQEMSRQIRQMAKESQQQGGPCSSQTRNEVNQSMQRSGNSMRQVASRRQAQSALNQLGQQLQQCQNRMSGQGQRPGPDGSGQGGEGQQPGGQGAGEGVDRSRRPPGMASPSQGNMEQLSGQLGEGESEKMIEDAASGTGTSSGSGAERGAVGYERQVEDFVRREDIPEAMKHGVKTYFEQIHEMSAEPPAASGQ